MTKAIGIGAAGGGIAGGVIGAGSGGTAGALAGAPAGGVGAALGAGAEFTAGTFYGSIAGADLGGAAGLITCKSGSGQSGGSGDRASGGSNENKTADRTISEQKKASIRTRFPGQYLNKTLAQIRREAQSGSGKQAAKTAYKMLTSSEYNK